MIFSSAGRLSDGDRRELLALARRSAQLRVSGQVAVAPAGLGALSVPRGAFVSIKLRQHLRGCIGYTGRDQPLAEVVWRCAAASATEDPRFPPMLLDELMEAWFEISVLGSFEALEGPASIEIGRHGVMVEHGAARGLLLPQVALDWGWDAERFVEQTCLKAGLEAQAWRAGARLLRFEAEVFGEEGRPR